MNSTTPFSISYRGRLLDLSQPQIMGILNVTDNSFYAESRCATEEQIANRTREIIDEGGTIIDLGACSTHPGSQPVTPQQEIDRLTKAIEIIESINPQIPLSIDTYRADVAKALMEKFGPLIINDIAAGEMDPNMFSVVTDWQAPYILTHIQGTPTNMQVDPHYDDVVAEVIDFFNQRVEKLKRMGATNLILDPGFGFGKSVDDNYTLLRNMEAFHALELPILVGVSRKSMIYKITNGTPQTALAGTIAINAIALLKKAHIIRVHDVQEAVDTRTVVQRYMQQKEW